MVEKRTCSFCGGDIEPGTGLQYIKKDGDSFNFCSKKCKTNQLELGRASRYMKWTKNFVRVKTEGETAEDSEPKKAKKKSAEPEKKASAGEEKEEPSKGDEPKAEDKKGPSGEKPKKPAKDEQE
jgi:large subunit ribosomal protein L24e